MGIQVGDETGTAPVGAGYDVVPSGFLVALVGFLLTRFLVVETLRIGPDPVPFLLTGLVPLLIGLVLSIFGVSLAVGAFSRTYVDTVARWCLLGAGTMVVVLGLTVADGALRGAAMPTVTSGVLVANTLLGGAIVGVLIGDRSAVNRRQRRTVARQADQALVLNRVLRHEVLNAASIIGGYAELLEGRDGEVPEDPIDAIRSQTERIDETIADVGFLAEHRTPETVGAIDLATPLANAIEDVRSRYPDATVTVEEPLPDATVVGDERAATLFAELLENAVEHGGDDRTVAVTTAVDEYTAPVRIDDVGPGLPEPQRALLEHRSFPEYDDPNAGFGLAIVRLLADQFGAGVSVSAGDSGTTVSVTFDRDDASGRYGVPARDLLSVGVASLVAGAVMGALLQEWAGVMPVIGALYGAQNGVLGWLTHQFHSVVFGVLFAAGCRGRRLRSLFRTDRAGGVVTLGVAWGLVLWLVAAGVVMPIWLSLGGFPATVPNLSRFGLVGHVVWGAALGLVYAALAEL